MERKTILLIAIVIFIICALCVCSIVAYFMFVDKNSLSNLFAGSTPTPIASGNDIHTPTPEQVQEGAPTPEHVSARNLTGDTNLADHALPGRR